MQFSDLPLVMCLECKNDLMLYKGTVTSGHIEHGILKCTECGMCYPVIDFVVVMFKKEKLLLHLSESELQYLNIMGYSECIPNSFNVDTEYMRQVDVASNWEYQWTQQYNYSNEDFSKNYFLSEEMFYEFIPVRHDDVAGKHVCIVCSGKGREAYNILLRNPEKIACCEIGSEIYQTRHVVNSDKILLIKSDAMDVPLKSSAFDLVICDHALQHVLDHQKAFSEMSRVAGPTGNVAINVYSYENNFIMTKLIDPSKVIIHKFPLPVIYYLSVIPAIFVFLAIYAVYVPLNTLSKSISKYLPLNDHMMYWSKYNSFKTMWTWCFDLIHAPISYHFRKDEVVGLAKRNNLQVRYLENVHGTTWTMIAEKQQGSPREHGFGKESV